MRAVHFKKYWYRLARSKSTSIEDLLTIARSPDVDLRTVEALLRRGKTNYDVVRALFANKLSNPQYIVDAQRAGTIYSIDSDVGSFSYRIARKKDLPSDLLTLFAHYELGEITQAIAQRRDVPYELQVVLSKSKDRFTRQFLAESKHTAPDILEYLCNDIDRGVVSQAILNSKLPASKVKELAGYILNVMSDPVKHSEEMERFNNLLPIIVNKKLPVKMLYALFDASYLGFDTRIPLNPNCPKDLVLKEFERAGNDAHNTLVVYSCLRHFQNKNRMTEDDIQFIKDHANHFVNGTKFIEKFVLSLRISEWDKSHLLSWFKML
jgi:hypothetical protein